MILQGELQLERKEVGQESVSRDCVNILVEKTINPETNSRTRMAHCAR